MYLHNCNYFWGLKLKIHNYSIILDACKTLKLGTHTHRLLNNKMSNIIGLKFNKKRFGQRDKFYK